MPPKLLPHKSKKITKEEKRRQELSRSQSVKAFFIKKKAKHFGFKTRETYLDSGRCVFTKAASRAAAVDKEPLPLN